MFCLIFIVSLMRNQRYKLVSFAGNAQFFTMLSLCSVSCCSSSSCCNFAVMPLYNFGNRNTKRITDSAQAWKRHCSICCWHALHCIAFVINSLVHCLSFNSPIQVLAKSVRVTSVVWVCTVHVYSMLGVCTFCIAFCCVVAFSCVQC